MQSHNFTISQSHTPGLAPCLWDCEIARCNLTVSQSHNPTPPGLPPGCEIVRLWDARSQSHNSTIPHPLGYPWVVRLWDCEMLRTWLQVLFVMMWVKACGHRRSGSSRHLTWTVQHISVQWTLDWKTTSTSQHCICQRNSVIQLVSLLLVCLPALPQLSTSTHLSKSTEWECTSACGCICLCVRMRCQVHAYVCRCVAMCTQDCSRWLSA